VLRDFYTRVEPSYQVRANSFREFLSGLPDKEKLSFWFFLGPALVLPLLLVSPKPLFQGPFAILTASLLLMMAGLTLLNWVLYPH
jgi:hypothetical protein